MNDFFDESPNICSMDHVPIELMHMNQDKGQIIASNVYTCATSNQGNIFTVHGSLSAQRHKEYFPTNMDMLSPNYYLLPDKILHMRPHRNSSIILHGLHRNTIIIHQKINHILLRSCQSCRIYLKMGTVSGVDVLYCNQVLLKTKLHNFTNLEFGESIYFHGETDDHSQLHIRGSMDVTVNNKSVEINPFMNIIITKNTIMASRQDSLPKLSICKL